MSVIRTIVHRNIRFMTTQLLMMNRSAVVVGADSAVTVTAEGGKLHYHGTNKIYGVSNDAPVVVMVNGSSRFFGIPWETVIKDFRESKYNLRSARTMEEYCESLISYIGHFVTKYKDKLDVEYSEGRDSRQPITDNSYTYVDINDLESQYDLIITKTWRRLSIYNHNILKDINLNHPDVNKVNLPIIDKLLYKQLWCVVTSRLKHLNIDINDSLPVNPEAPEILSVKRKTNDTFETYFGPLFKQIRGFNNDYCIDSQKNIDTLEYSLRLFQYIALTNRYMSKPKSWLIFAGFGTDDLFPKSIRFGFSVGIRGELIYSKTEYNIESGEPAVLKPFGSTEIIDSFLNGISPQYQSKLNYTIRAAAQPAEQDATDSGVANDRLPSYFDHVERTMAENYRKKVLATIAQLPKHVMADIVENFIKIASIQSHIRDNDASVGGSVSIAVVTKGDGFVWVNRQSYFEQSKNPQFYAKMHSCQNNCSPPAPKEPTNTRMQQLLSRRRPRRF